MRHAPQEPWPDPLGAGPGLTARTVRTRWMAAVLPRLTGRVLDAGAGRGDSLDHLRPGVQVTLVDPRPRAVRALRERAAGREGAEVLQAGVEDLGGGDPEVGAAYDGVFNAVVCSLVLCSVADQARALEALHRVLAPGGRLVFLEHVAAPPRTGARRLQGLLKPVTRTLQHGCDPTRDTGAALEASPFVSVDARQVDLPVGLGLRVPVLYGTALRAR